MSRFTTIIFDQGEVIFTNDFDVKSPEFYEHYEVAPDQFKESYNKFKIPLRLGEYTEAEFWTNLLTDAKANSTDPTFAIQYNRDYQQIKPGMLELIQKLYGQKFDLVILSNTLDEILDHKFEKFPIKKYFKTIVTSSTVKLIKPDPQIFLHTLNEIDISSNECIFVDDTEKNIVTAESLGITSILFESAAQLIIDLERLGIQV